MKIQLKTNAFQRRVTFFMLFWLTNILCVVSAQAQKVSVTSKSITVKQVLTQIETQTGYRFFYNNDVNLARRLPIKVSNENLHRITKPPFSLYICSKRRRTSPLRSSSQTARKARSLLRPCPPKRRRQGLRAGSGP